MSPNEFRFRFHPAFRVAAMPFLVRPGNCRVTVSDNELTAMYGPWSVRTPLSNIAGATVSEGYSWPKTIGPAHLSLSDRGLTFESNPDAAVCMEFRRPVRGIDPFGLILHPGLTVTIEQPEALAELLGRSAG